MPDNTPQSVFEVLNEIGIIEQLARTLFEARLPEGYLVSHFSILNHLTRVSDGQTPLDMARAFQVPKTTMTHTLARLAKDGLVEMRDNPDDGRSKRVWLTDEGRAFRENAIASLAPDAIAALGHLGADTFEDLLPRLRQLRAYLDDARNT